MTGEKRYDVAEAAAVVPAQRAGNDPLCALASAQLGRPPSSTARLAGPQLPDVRYGALDVVYCAEDVFGRHAANGTLARFVHTALTALRPGGVLVAPVPVFGPRRPVSSPPRVMDGERGRELLVSTWDWAADGRSYTIEVLRLLRGAGGWELLDTTATTHQVLTRGEVHAALRSAGFAGVHVVEPADSGHPVPLWLGVRP